MKVALLVDGGYLRACAKKASLTYDNAFIIAFSNRCILPDEYLLRIFYYDAPQYRGNAQLPVSGNQTTFQSSDTWLTELGKAERFAVRRGTLGFRGWKPKSIPIAGGRPLSDSDFTPIFEQKGVDMRIGLDIATFSHSQAVDRIVLLSGDQDMVPAMKEARKAGLEVVTIQLPPPTKTLHDLIQEHSDIVRRIELVL